MLGSGQTDDCIELPLKPYPRQHGVEPFFETRPPVSGVRDGLPCNGTPQIDGPSQHPDLTRARLRLDDSVGGSGFYVREAGSDRCRLRCGTLSREFRRRKYRPADEAIWQQIIELYQELGYDANTSASCPTSGDYSLDTQLPAPAPGVTDAWGDQQGRISALAGDRAHWGGEKHFGNRGHSA